MAHVNASEWNHTHLSFGWLGLTFQFKRPPTPELSRHMTAVGMMTNPNPGDVLPAESSILAAAWEVQSG